ncbi:MAG: hypothetical protein KY395_00180 [Actinobacteria bacterium]|nr:hypothetical protein [Actinomycetota bacterium]
MRIVRRLTAVVGVVALAGAFVASAPAGADTPEVYAGSALGRALNLSVLGQSATFGVSTAKIDSTLKASADGAGQVLVLGSTTEADVSGNNTKQEAPQECAAAVDVAAPLLDLGLVCSASTAEVANGMPHAVSEGSLAKLDVAANTLPINSVIAPVQDALEGVFGALPDTLDPATDTVSDLLTAVGTTKTLEAVVGHSRSEVSTDAGVVTAVGQAEAAQVDLLPVGGLLENPVASIIVSSAKATAVYDRAAGTANASFDPAIVTVRLSTPLTGNTEVKVAPGETITILAGTPLESTITAADGSVTNNPDGSVSAVADGVKLELLKGVNGGVVLELAHAEAGAAGSPAVLSSIVEVAELPRTGGMPWIPVAGIGAVGLAIVARRVVLSLH